MKAKDIAWLLGAAAIITLGTLGVLAVARRGASSLKAGPVATITPGPAASRGQKVFISEGRIAVLDFIKFLSSYTGLPVLHDSTDPRIASGQIHIAADIKDADEEVVKAILEVNRWRVLRETLPSGKEVLKVESMQPTRPAPSMPTLKTLREVDQ